MAAMLTSQPDNFPPTPATVIGNIPPFLRGKLLRNGPSQWVHNSNLQSPSLRPQTFKPHNVTRHTQEVGDSKLLHWFDGFAAIHAFEMDGQGGVMFRQVQLARH